MLQQTSGLAFETLLFDHGFAGKLRRFAVFPAISIPARTRIPQALHWLRTRYAEREIRRRGLDSLLIRRSDAALVQDPADLLFLYRTVLRKGPGRVLELGSGQSTLFIAQALYERGDGHLWSLDADAEWLAHSRQMLPEHLRPFVTFVHSPARITTRHGCAAMEYQDKPAGPWDFVLIDGPAPIEGVTFSSDLIDLELTPGATGMIDHRWRTAALAKEIAGHRLRFRYMPSLESFVFQPR